MLILRILIALLLCWIAWHEGAYFIERMENEYGGLGLLDWPIFIEAAHRFMVSGEVYVRDVTLYGPAAAIYKFPPLSISVLVALIEQGLSDEVLKNLGGVVNHVLFFASIAACLWVMKKEQYILLIPLALVFAFNFEPFIDNYVRLQLEGFILLCLALALALFMSGRDFLSGVCIGIAAVTKIYPLFFSAPYFALRRWRALAGVVVGMVVTLPFSIAILGWSEHVYYVSHVAPFMLVEDLFITPENVSLGNFIVLWEGSKDWALRAGNGLVSGCLLFLFVTTWPRDSDSEKQRDLFASSLALLVCVFVFGYKNSWWHYQILLALPFVVLVTLATRRRYLDMWSLPLIVLAGFLIFQSHGARLLLLTDWFAQQGMSALWRERLFAGTYALRALANILLVLAALRIHWRVARPSFSGA